MKRLLVIVDMQNDFITGVLGNDECRAIVPKVVEKYKSFDGDGVAFTLDTHFEDYLDTQEGKLLPIKHCIRGTDGWQLIPELQPEHLILTFEKETFGSTELARYIKDNNYTDVTFVGVCTDICVISNAMVTKAFNPEISITVDSSCCAGVTKESHENALKAMAACQIHII